MSTRQHRSVVEIDEQVQVATSHMLANAKWAKNEPEYYYARGVLAALQWIRYGEAVKPYAAPAPAPEPLPKAIE